MEKIRKYKWLLRFVLAAIIFIIVFLDSGKFLDNLSLERVRQYLNSYGITQLLAIGLLGIISNIPSIGYDLVLSRKTKIKEKWKKIITISYAINAYNKTVSLIETIYVGLRYFFFYKKAEKKAEFPKTIDSILPFQIIGLSILAFITSLLVLSGHWTGYADRYVLIIHSFSLYFIGLLVLVNLTSFKVFEGLSMKDQLTLAATSILEWATLCSSFLLVGLVIGIDFDLLLVAILVIVASLIGILSTIPGGWGSFDLVTLAGLMSMGLSGELALTWLIVYRLGVFILPFFLSTGIFFQQLVSDAKNKLAHDVGNILRSLLHKANASFIYLYGLIFIAPIVDLTDVKLVNEMTNLLFQNHLNLINNFLSIAIGILYVFIGRLVFCKQEKALNILIPSSLVTVLYLLVNGGGWWSILAHILMIALTYLTRKQHFRIKFLYAWEDLTVDLIIISLVSIINFNQIGQDIMRKPQLSISISLIYIVLFIFFMILLLKALLSYLKSDQDNLKLKTDILTFIDFKTKYGTSLEGNLYFTGDKSIFYYENEGGEKTIAFQYAIEGNKLLVLSEPFGLESDQHAALEAFIEISDRLSYQPVFYEVGEKTTLKLHDYGYHFLKLGELALVAAQKFSLQGHRMKNQRYVLSRFEKDGLSFQVLKAPHKEETLAKLKEISDKWLGSRKEMGYSLGFFQRDYLQACDLAIVTNSDGRIIAFANLLRDELGQKLGIDLMRFDKNSSPNATMDFMFIKLFLYAQKEGYHFFSLGMAPLSNVGLKPTAPILERFVHLVYKYGNKFYSFSGLRRYKAKYASKWLPHYISYFPHSWLIYDIIALLIVSKRPVDKEI